jgi:Uma2 family endonuclease
VVKSTNLKEEGFYMTEYVKPIKRNVKIKRKYTAEEFFEFIKEKEERYELINGIIYLMAAPSLEHQDIAGYIYRKLGNYLEGKTCKPFISPVDVVLFEKDKADKSQNVFQPYVFVVCDPKKTSDKKRINGAPDFIVEVVSPSSSETDYSDKFEIYMKYGVKEYWIVNPEKRNILVYIKNEKEKTFDTYTFEDKVKVSIFDDFEIDFKGLSL